MVRTRRRIPALVLLLSCAAWLPHCKPKATPNQGEKLRDLDDRLTISALRSYADIAFAAYDDSVRGVQALGVAIEALLAAPSPQTLARAQQAWLAARIPYVQTEVFRFYDGPIDAVELQINTWPIDESFVEAADGERQLGIVQDTERFPVLSAGLLAELNGKDGETSISTGYHVLEFLLWGRDTNEAGPGERSYHDFVTQGKTRAAALAERRGSYLRIACQLLEQHLVQVREAWSAGEAPSYREHFLAPPPERGLYLALRGMAKLSGPELAGERLTVPYETKSQENEHSCFSDNTHADVVGDALGVENVCLGRYTRTDGTRISGPGICAAVAHALPLLGRALTRQISDSVSAARSIPAPFDRAIVGDDKAAGRAAIKRTIVSLREQAVLTERALNSLALEEPVRVSVAR